MDYLKHQLLKIGTTSPQLRKHIEPLLDFIVTAQSIPQKHEEIISDIEYLINIALRPIRKSSGNRSYWEDRKFVGNKCILRGHIRTGNYDNYDNDDLIDRVRDLAEEKLKKYSKIISELNIDGGDKDYVEIHIIIDLKRIPRERMTKEKAFQSLKDLKFHFKSKGTEASSPVLLKGDILCYQQDKANTSFFVLDSGGIWYVESKFTLTQSMQDALPIEHKDLTYDSYVSKGNYIIKPRKYVGWYLPNDPNTRELLLRLNKFLKLPVHYHQSSY